MMSRTFRRSMMLRLRSAHKAAAVGPQFAFVLEAFFPNRLV